METHPGKILFPLPSQPRLKKIPSLGERRDFSCGPCHFLSVKLWQTATTSADSYCVAKPLRRQALVTPLQVKEQVKQVALSGRWQLAIRLGPQLTTEHKDTSPLLAESEVERV